MKQRFFYFIILTALTVILVRPALAFEEINKSFIGGVGLSGFDAVSYFMEGKAVAGDKSLSFEWKGAKWLFSNPAHRDRFKANPQAYAPQYGGHCSNQMSLGNLSDIDPKVWLVFEGKLYLFGHDVGRQRWSEKTSQRIAEADANWRRFLAQ